MLSLLGLSKLIVDKDTNKANLEIDVSEFEKGNEKFKKMQSEFEEMKIENKELKQRASDLQEETERLTAERNKLNQENQNLRNAPGEKTKAIEPEEGETHMNTLNEIQIEEVFASVGYPF